MRQSFYNQLAGFRHFKKARNTEKLWNPLPKNFSNNLYNFFNLSGGAATDSNKTQAHPKNDDYELDLISMKKIPKFKRNQRNNGDLTNMAKNIRSRKRHVLPKSSVQNDFSDTSLLESSIKTLLKERKQRDWVNNNTFNPDGNHTVKASSCKTSKPIDYRDEITYDKLFSNIPNDDSKLKCMNKENNKLGLASKSNQGYDNVIEKFNNLETVVKMMESKINNVEGKSAKKFEEIENKIEDLSKSNIEINEKLKSKETNNDKLSSKSLEKIDEIFQSEDNLQILEDLLNDVKNSQKLERESKFREIRAYEWSKNKILHPDKTIFLPFYRGNSNLESSMNGYFNNLSNSSLFPTVSRKQMFARKVKGFVKTFLMISGFGFISLLVFDIFSVRL